MNSTNSLKHEKERRAKKEQNTNLNSLQRLLKTNKKESTPVYFITTTTKKKKMK